MNISTAALRLRTPRLELIASDAALARADADGRRDRLAELLAAEVPPEWPPPLLADHLAEFARTLAGDPGACGWHGWYMVLEAPGRVLIGSAGTGEPTEAGESVFGYSVLDRWQRRGYATEAMRAILTWACGCGRVRELVAYTYPPLRPSIRVLEKLGLAYTGPGPEPDTIRYAISRERWLQNVSP